MNVRASIIQVALLLSATTFLFAATRVSANPVVDPTTSYDTTFYLDGGPAKEILILIAINFMVNLLFFSLGILIISSRMGRRAMSLPGTGLQFLAIVLLAVTIVTVFGAVIDYYVASQEYTSEYSDAVHRSIIWDTLRWFVATSLILAVIWSTSVIVLGLGADRALLLAGMMALISPIWWALSSVFGYIVPAITIFLSLLLAPVVLRNLVRWYNELLPAKASTST